MSFAAIESALISRISTHADFASSFITTADYRVLASGYPRAIISQYGGLNRGDLTLRLIRDEWLVNLELYTRYNGELDSLSSAMNTNRQNLIDTIEDWPALNGTTGVFRAKIRNIGPEQSPEASKGAPHYASQTVVVLVIEDYDPGRLEA